MPGVRKVHTNDRFGCTVQAEKVGGPAAGAVFAVDHRKPSVRLEVGHGPSQGRQARAGGGGEVRQAGWP